MGDNVDQVFGLMLFSGNYYEKHGTKDAIKGEFLIGSNQERTGVGLFFDEKIEKNPLKMKSVFVFVFFLEIFQVPQFFLSNSLICNSCF